MEKAIIGKKLGMTQVFTASGKVIPVTVVEAGPCTVIAKKTAEKDGYKSLVVAYGDIKESRVNKPQLTVFKRINANPKKFIKEFDLAGDYEVGAEIKCDIFSENDKVDVSGISKGHGFSGVIKRHGFRRNRMSHGAGPIHREVGSTGASSTPARVFKNKKMPGQFGHVNVTIQNLEVVKVDKDRNLLLIKGCVPGPRGSVIVVKEAVKGGKN
ncbi:MAG: 50S ribosomal protein L3 [Clostridia bacterium]|nr:50S ribosomal protein L3 [Clostridia bacterium]MDD4686037.1 50S ribosomal protein L3 [Clostridia bacterium]